VERRLPHASEGRKEINPKTSGGRAEKRKTFALYTEMPQHEKKLLRGKREIQREKVKEKLKAGRGGRRQDISTHSQRRHEYLNRAYRKSGKRTSCKKGGAPPEGIKAP